MAKLRKALKKGVTVEVIAGREKGKQGSVAHVDWKLGRVVVEKLNIQKRHSKPAGQNRQGGIIDKEGPIAISNVKILSEAKVEAKKATKKATKKTTKKSTKKKSA